MRRKLKIIYQLMHWIMREYYNPLVPFKDRIALINYHHHPFVKMRGGGLSNCLPPISQG